MRLIDWAAGVGFVLAAVPAFGQMPVVETGVLGGADYRIDIPTNWNHSLVVYYHGYAEKPTHLGKGPLGATQAVFVGRGYAVIQSGFSTTGWALPVAYADTEALRLKFVADHGMPRQTFVTGESMGGALTMMTMEKRPDVYTGALDLCGAIVPANEWSQRRFALRAAFDFYFPGVLPPISPAPDNFVETPEMEKAALDAMAGKPDDAKRMERLTGLYRDKDIAHLMVYVTYQASDFYRKAGGSVVDTQNWIYTGTGSVEEDFRLNDGVKRYVGDAKARAWMVANYSGTGRLKKPMLAVHTVYDTLIPPGSLAMYAERVAEAGDADRFVQQFVDEVGHCAFKPDEIGRAFDELTNWVQSGVKPVGGKLP